MHETTLPLPELALVAGTRVALGAGLGLVLGERLTAEQRRAAGLALLLIGLVSTVPPAAEVLSRTRRGKPPCTGVSPG